MSANPQATRIHWPHYTGILLLSLATLLLELALTRVLSVSNWYHFGFLVVSTALLGFGASGVTLSLWTKLREELPLNHVLATISLLFSLISIVSFWMMQRIPFRPFQLFLDPSQFFYTMLYYLMFAAPFFCSGLAISLLLTRSGPAVHRMYAADLLGAGLGCAAVCVVMPYFGGSGSVVVAAVFGALAAVAFNSFRPSRLTLLGGVAVVGLLALAFVAEKAMPISVLPEKLHPLQPASQAPIYTKWNSFSKVDVYEAAAVPEQGRPTPGLSIILDAGGAGTFIPDLSVGVRDYLAHAGDYHPSGLAYIGKAHPKVLILGSGAGREVLEALYFGSSSITAIEINPIINEIVTKGMRHRWGGLFEQPEVRLVTEDGRSFVRRSQEKYDAIISIFTMSDAALSSGALTLSESYLFTREAFEDYWDHLTPDGTLLITRPKHQIPKLFATAREMFEQLDLGSPAQYLFAFRGEVAPFGHRRFTTGMLLHKTPFQPDEIETMAKRMGIVGSTLDEDNAQPEIFYSPFAPPRNEYQSLLTALAGSSDLSQSYAATDEMLEPATDDKPFFNQRMRWSKLRPNSFRSVLGTHNLDVDYAPVGEVTLVIMFIQAVIIAAVLIILPLARFGRAGLPKGSRWGYLTYFACLGAGFILIEIALLQRLELYLGQPIYTLSVVLAALLMSTGVGSYLASKIREDSRKILGWLLLAVVGNILFISLIMPPILAYTLPLSLPLRVAVAVLLVAQLGVLLGIPFPTGLRLVSKEASHFVPWAWAVNGFFTVIGSVGAMILGMAFGFTVVLLFAATCYLISFVVIRAGTAAPASQPAYTITKRPKSRAATA